MKERAAGLPCLSDPPTPCDTVLISTARLHPCFKAFGYCSQRSLSREPGGLEGLPRDGAREGHLQLSLRQPATTASVTHGSSGQMACPASALLGTLLITAKTHSPAVPERKSPHGLTSTEAGAHLSPHLCCNKNAYIELAQSSLGRSSRKRGSLTCLPVIRREPAG